MQPTSFNPRTYIRYDVAELAKIICQNGFNPRTYIRYDGFFFAPCGTCEVSIHVPI